MQDDCTAPQIVGDEVWCSVETEDTYETYRHDAASSELIDTIAIDGLDLPIPPGKAKDRGFDGVRNMYGMPFAEYSTGELWDDHDMVLARLSDDFKTVLWQATFVDGSEEDLPFSRRLHHDVLTSSVYYAIGADDGTLLPVCNDPKGCANIEWVADNVLMGQPDAAQAVTFPDGTPGVLTGPGAISVASSKLPPNPLRFSNGAIEAYDGLTGDALWSAPAPELSGDIASYRGLQFGLLAAYDGSRVVVADMDGHVLAFDADDGTALWNVSLPLVAPQAMPGFMDDGLLLIQQIDYADSEDEEAEEGFLYALDPVTGETWWSVNGQLAGVLMGVHPFMDNASAMNDILIQTQDGKLIRLVPR